MDHSNTGGIRSTKNQRRDAAREKARQLREEQKKKERRSKFILQGSLILVTLAIVTVVVFVIFSTIKPPAPGPLNMLSDGIKIGQDLDAVQTPALKPSASPVQSSPNIPADVLDIRVYVDYMCPACGAFEAQNAAQIEQQVKEGAATIEIHPVAILDHLSQGTKYSSRASNAAACVANFSPDNFFDFSALLFEHQPEENTPGLSDEQLAGFAKEAGVAKFSNIQNCITKQSFASWVKASTDRFLSGPIPNTIPQPERKGTPTIVVNGQLYQDSFDADTFASFLLKVLGEQYTDESTPSPSPSVQP